jgi:hypothetical protein
MDAVFDSAVFSENVSFESVVFDATAVGRPDPQTPRGASPWPDRASLRDGLDDRGHAGKYKRGQRDERDARPSVDVAASPRH